jgi:hypothetical protein
MLSLAMVRTGLPARGQACASAVAALAHTVRARQGEMLSERLLPGRCHPIHNLRGLHGNKDRREHPNAVIQGQQVTDSCSAFRSADLFAFESTRPRGLADFDRVKCQRLGLSSQEREPA